MKPKFQKERYEQKLCGNQEDERALALLNDETKCVTVIAQFCSSQQSRVLVYLSIYGSHMLTSFLVLLHMLKIVVTHTHIWA